jgi:hypothetical protein
MFERYTEKARRVVFFARYEASQFGSPEIDTEHLLLGLLREDKGLNHYVFQSHAAVDAIRNELTSGMKQNQPIATHVDLPLSDPAKLVLAYAGLLREKQTLAAQVLERYGLELRSLRERLASLQPDKAQGGWTAAIGPLASGQIEFRHGEESLGSLPSFLQVPRNGDYVILHSGERPAQYRVVKVSFEYEEWLNVPRGLSLRLKNVVVQVEPAESE